MTALLLIHGLGGSRRVWEPVLERLGGEVDARAVDLRGGASMADEAAALEPLLDAGGAGPAVVAGHSMGGLVATALAERAPDRVRRLVLVNTPPTLESRTTARSGGERALRLPLVGPLLWKAAGRRGLARGAASAVAPGAAVPDVLVDDLVRTGHGRWAGSTRAIDAYLAERPLADRLRPLGVPVDVLFGDRDQRVDPASLTVYDAVPRATVHPFPGLGHSPLLEAPDAVADALHHALRP